jgi:hypothetical protein
MKMPNAQYDSLDECLMIMIHERERKKATAARGGNDGGSLGNRPARRTGMRYKQSVLLLGMKKQKQKIARRCKRERKNAACVRT